jgi:hypothetical protein
MKTNKNTTYFNTYRCLCGISILRIWKRLYAIMWICNPAIFQQLKAENEKLQIVFANIRV